MRAPACNLKKPFLWVVFTIVLSLSGALEVQAELPGGCTALQMQMGTLSTKELADEFEACQAGDPGICFATVSILAHDHDAEHSIVAPKHLLEAWENAGFLCERGKGRRADREKFLNKLQKLFVALQQMPMESIASNLRSMDKDTIAHTATVCQSSGLRLMASGDENAKCRIVIDYAFPPGLPKNNACALLAAYVQVGRPKPDWVGFVEGCNSHPDKLVCEATGEIIQSDKIDIKKLGLTCKG